MTARTSHERGSAIGRRAIIEAMEPRRLLSGDHFELEPQGSEFLVNDTVERQQFVGDVAMNRHGDFAIVYDQPSPAGPGRIAAGNAYVRLYDRKGRVRGEPIQVNTAVRSLGLEPAIAMDHRGNFVVAWVGQVAPHVVAPDIYARRFDRKGRALGDEFRVNTFIPGFHGSPDIAVDHSGTFIITWTQFPFRAQQAQQDGSGAGIFAQRFDRHGQPIGGEFGLSSATAGAQGLTSVAMGKHGDFVVSFTSADGVNANGSNSPGVFARRFDADGVPHAAEFLVNQHTAGNQLPGGVAMDRHGNFAVTWSGAGPETDGEGIYVRRFDADGAARAEQLRVSPVSSALLESNPAIAMDRRGNFVVTWDSRQNTPPPVSEFDWAIFGQLYDSAGSTLGDAFRVTTIDTLSLFNGGVGMSDKGDLVMTWSRHGQDAPDTWGVFARRFEVDFDDDGDSDGDSDGGSDGGSDND